MRATKPDEMTVGIEEQGSPAPQPSDVVAGSLADWRRQVRSKLREDLEGGAFVPTCDAWMTGHDPAYSRRLGRRGWLGLTWPRDYGGAERGGWERYVVTEELLAAGAPVAAHWAADRQVGPMLLRYGTPEQRERFLPTIAEGRSFWAIGMSEPDAGSDLSAVRTRAVLREGRWYVSGTKVWTSHAQRSHYSVVFCRTVPVGESGRHDGHSQLIVDLNGPGVSIRPIRTIDGGEHLNEMVFDEAPVPESMLVGTAGAAWTQVTSELAFERSGPERFLSTFPLLASLTRQIPTGDRLAHRAIGSLVAGLTSLRKLSTEIALELDHGSAPEVQAALVKDLGTRLENAIVEAARAIRSAPDSSEGPDDLTRLLTESVLHAPSFTLRGGTTEVLRTIVARALTTR